VPAEPALICAYLTERAADGLSVGTIDLACGAIAYRHRMQGLRDPVLTEGVRQVRRGLRRIIGTTPRRQARPLGTGEIRHIVQHIDRSTAVGARDAAIILLGFASAMRRSELAELTLADVEFQPGGILLTIRRSKTSTPTVRSWPWSTASTPSRTPSQHSTPGSATADLIPADSSRACAIGPSPASRSPARPSRSCPASAPRPLGWPPKRITAHSLRAGHATSAAVAGVALDRIAAQTRHKRLSTLLERYIRPAQAWSTPPAATSASSHTWWCGRISPFLM
jgi:integrase